MSQNLKAERAALLDEAQAIVNNVKGRDITTAEDARVQSILADVKAIDDRVDTAASARKMLADVVGGRGANIDFASMPVEALDGQWRPGARAAGIGGFTASKSRAMWNQARTGSAAVVEVDGRKAYTGGVSVPYATIADSAGGVYPTAGSLLDLFPHRNIDGPTVRVYRTTTAASVAAVTAEGAVKPDAGLTIGYTDVSVSKIAAVSKLSEELLSDYGDFVSFVANEVTQAVKVRENAWAAALILGMSGIQTYAPAAGVTVVDAVADGIATCQANGIEPTSIVMGPADMAKARKSKATTSGVYNFDPLLSGPGSLFGLQTVVTPSLAANTVLLGDFANAGWVGLRDPMTVALGLDTDDWSRNLRTLRVEERLLLAVPVPSRLMKITLS